MQVVIIIKQHRWRNRGGGAPYFSLTLHRIVNFSMQMYLENPGADPGFLEGGVRIRGGPKKEKLTLVLYL